jgi:hypothetical protein
MGFGGKDPDATVSAVVKSYETMIRILQAQNSDLMARIDELYTRYSEREREMTDRIMALTQPGALKSAVVARAPIPRPPGEISPHDISSGPNWSVKHEMPLSRPRFPDRPILRDPPPPLPEDGMQKVKLDGSATESAD